MATNTYVALDTQTLVSATNIVTFTSIPSTYTDLVLVINTSNSESTSQPYIQFNSDTSGSSTNYSTTSIRGDGSNGASSRHSNNFGWYPVPGPGVGTNGNFEPWVVNISNYSNTSVFKSAVSRFNNAVSIVSGNIHLWRSQSAISSITIKMESGNFNIGSTFSVYGIRAEGVTPAPKATGGAIYSDADYYYHVFGASGTFTPLQSLSCNYLVVAGGGGGGSAGGGGGAGGLRSSITTTGGGGTLESPLSLTAQNYTVTIGAGGVGRSGSDANPPGENGNNSVFATITSTGGGGGGSRDTTITSRQEGQNGGSGGGANLSSSVGGTGTSGQGFGGGTNGTGFNSGGGGGAGAVGANGGGSGAGGGAGGAGVANIIAGVSTVFAGGGGGGTNATNSSQFAAGGNGGGGAGGGGGGSGTSAATAGTANTGGGGGGGGIQDGGIRGASANGGSGIVVVRYAKA